MINSATISPHHSSLSWKDVTVAPYQKAGKYFGKFQKVITNHEIQTSDRIIKGAKYLGLTILFGCPLINIIAQLVNVILFSPSGQTDAQFKTPGMASFDATIPPTITDDSETKTQPTITTDNFLASIDTGSIDEKVSQSIALISNLIAYINVSSGQVQLKQCYDYHAIHNHLTRLSKYIGSHQNDLKQQFLQFLEEMETVRLCFPNGRVNQMKLARERFTLDHPDHHYQVVTSVSDTLTKAEISQIVSIEQQSFSAPYSRSRICRFVRNQSSKVILAKIEDQIVGVLLYLPGHIDSVARRPDAVMGVGTALFQKLREQLQHNPPERVRLQIRASNAAAIALYEKYGFIKVDTSPSYYSHPREDASIMESQTLAT